MLKKLILIILFLVISVNSFADRVIIPFECDPKEIQASFARNGKKLDLSGNDKTSDSWGFIVNKGQEYEIFTYRPVTEEDFEILLKCPMEVRQKKMERENENND